MLVGFFVVVLIAGVFVLVVAAVAAALLGLGTGLSRVFSVTTFEATIIATAVAAAIFVVLMFTRTHWPYEDLEPFDEEDVGPTIILPPMPLTKPRRGKKPKR